MQFFQAILLLQIAIVQQTLGKKQHNKDASEEEVTEKKSKVDENLNPVIDRLAVNLAGAFVKSIFPEVEHTTKPSVPINVEDVRRAPSSTFDLANNGQTGLYSSYQNPFPNIGAVPGLSAYTAGDNRLYRTDLPASYVYPFGQPGQPVSLPGGNQPFALGRDLLTNGLIRGISGIPTGSAVPPENIEAINRYRKEQYLADLQRHQQELNQYTASQLEYIDKQRKYQQAMVDHQAGAALLLQQQQQDLINKRIKGIGQTDVTGFEKFQQPSEDETGNKYLDQQTGGHVLQNAQNKYPSKQFAARTQLENAFPAKDDREEYASDEYLRKFFKDNYNIDINEDMNGEALTEEERSTLRELKDYLIKESNGKGIQIGALKTLENYKSKLSSRRKPSLQNTDKDEGMSREERNRKRNACKKCRPLQMQRLAGAWTQIFGNPAAMRKIYSTILSLKSINMKSGMVTTNLSPKKASCVGFQIRKPKEESSTMYLYFRDDTKRHELHEMSGKISNRTNGALELELSNLDSVC